MCSKEVAPVFYRSLIMFTVTLNLMFLNFFASSRMVGKKSIILILLGLGLSGGSFISGKLISLIEDVYLLIGAYSIILINKVILFYIKSPN